MQYCKDKIWSTGVLFVQEAHSDSKDEQKWTEDFKGHFFVSWKVKFMWLTLKQKPLLFKNNKQTRKVVF